MSGSLNRAPVLVTGAGGFIGSHVVELLLNAGHEVRALAHYNSFGRWGHLEGSPAAAHAKLEVRLGDVTDFSMMRTLVEGCDAVLHLAALIGIPNRYMHTPVELVSLTDVENASKLIAEWILSLKANTSFIPN